MFAGIMIGVVGCGLLWAIDSPLQTIARELVVSNKLKKLELESKGVPVDLSEVK